MVRWYYAIAMSAGMHRTRQLHGDMGRQQWLLLPEQITMHHRHPLPRRKRAECGQMDPGASATGPAAVTSTLSSSRTATITTSPITAALAAAIATRATVATAGCRKRRVWKWRVRKRRVRQRRLRQRISS